MTTIKDNRIVKYIVTWRSNHLERKDAYFCEQDLAESFYEEKAKENKSPSLYVTELVESTRKLK